jgi:hypothetical protein
LPNEIFIVVQLAHDKRQPLDLREIFLAQSRVFFEFLDENGERVDGDLPLGTLAVLSGIVMST